MDQRPQYPPQGRQTPPYRQGGQMPPYRQGHQMPPYQQGGQMQQPSDPYNAPKPNAAKKGMSTITGVLIGVVCTLVVVAIGAFAALVYFSNHMDDRPVGYYDDDVLYEETAEEVQGEEVVEEFADEVIVPVTDNVHTATTFNNRYIQLSGAINGKYNVVLNISVGSGSSPSVTGTYYYTKYGPNHTLDLRGNLLSDGRGLTLYETNDKGVQTGIFNGSLEKTGDIVRYTGTYINNQGKKMTFGVSGSY